jgi:hypothetical protein
LQRIKTKLNGLTEDTRSDGVRRSAGASTDDEPYDCTEAHVEEVLMGERRSSMWGVEEPWSVAATRWKMKQRNGVSRALARGRVGKSWLANGERGNARGNRDEGCKQKKK